MVFSQLYKALDLDNHGWSLVPSGLAAALDRGIAKAHGQKQGVIATCWAPTSVLVKYPMVMLQGPARDDAEWTR